MASTSRKPCECDMCMYTRDKDSHRGCRNLIKKPSAYNTKIVGSIYGTLIKTQGFLIRFVLQRLLEGLRLSYTMALS